MHCSIFTIEKQPFNKKMPPRSILKKSNVPKINYDSFERESNNVASIVNGCNKNGEPTKTNSLEDKDKDSFNVLEKITGQPIKELNKQPTVESENDSSTDQSQSSGKSVLEKPSDKHADEPSKKVNEESQNYSRTDQEEDSKNSFKERVLKRKWQPEDNSTTDQGQSPGQSWLKKPNYEHVAEPSEQVNEESQNGSRSDQSEDSKNSFKKRGLKRKWQPALTDGLLSLKYFRFIKKQSLILYGPNGPHPFNEF